MLFIERMTNKFKKKKNSLYNLYCSPFYIKDIIKLYTPARPLRSQNNCLICVPYTKTAKYGDSCFMKAAASLWNPLPIFLKFSVSVSSFKRNLKTYLLNNNNNNNNNILFIVKNPNKFN